MSARGRRFAWFARIVALLLAVLAATPALAGSPSPAARAAARDLVDADARGLALTIPPVPAGWVHTQRGPLDISYPRAIEPQLASALAHAESDVRAITARLGVARLPRLDVRLVPDPETMRALAPPQLPPPAYATGVAYPSVGLALVSARVPETWEAPDVRRVLRHEVSHLALEVATGHAAIPRWLSEGVAVEQAGEHDYDRFTHLAMATITGGVVPLRRLDAAFGGSNDTVDIAYAESADFVAYLWRDDDAGRFQVLLGHLREGRTLDDAVHQTWRVSLDQVEYEWRRDLRERFLTAPLWASTGLAWFIGMGLLLLAFARHRRRARATLERWAREERASEQRARFVVVTPGLLHGAPHEPDANPRTRDGDEASAPSPPIDPRTLN